MIDLKELNYEPDLFEKFCSEFLTVLGYEIVDEPSRGADGGIDLKVKDVKRGSDNSLISEVRWLVSCKNYSKSGKAVGIADEIDIKDRLKYHDCIGFIGFYSTIASSALSKKLKELSIPHALYFDQKIEKEIVGLPKREYIFARYFPNSYKKWHQTYNYSEPVKLFKFYVEENPFPIDIDELFGSIESSIKYFKQHKAPETLFKDLNIKYIKTSVFEEINWLSWTGSKLSTHLKKYNKDHGTTHIDKLENLWNIIIPKYLFDSISLDSTKQLPLVFSTDFKGDKQYMQFKNHIFVSKAVHAALENKIHEYHDILNN